MARRLIGIGITDAQGNVAIPYTGTGAGKLQIVAECGDLTSDTYELSDYLFYDSGFESTTSLASKWTLGSAVTRTSDENGTTLTITEEENVSNSNQYTNTTFTGDFEAIVYVENTSSSVGVRFGVNSGSTRRYVARSGNIYLRLVRENGTTTGYYSSDGENWTQKSLSGTEPSTNTVSVYIGMYIPTGTNSMSFVYNDLKVYYI